ncbi:hypothetical protein PC116_g32469 [Phytophthora cactorum]|nr:hypothetical protein PC116_g32469 [Phytophthora cactorum]
MLSRLNEWTSSEIETVEMASNSSMCPRPLRFLQYYSLDNQHGATLELGHS